MEQTNGKMRTGSILLFIQYFLERFYFCILKQLIDKTLQMVWVDIAYK